MSYCKPSALFYFAFRQTNDGGCINDQQLRNFTNAHADLPLAVCEERDGETHCEHRMENIYTVLVMSSAVNVVLSSIL